MRRQTLNVGARVSEDGGPCEDHQRPRPRPPITRKRLSVSGPPSQQPFQTRRPSQAAVARCEGLDVKSQSLFAVEFDNRGSPRQPRSRGDQELVLDLARPRGNGSWERMMTDASDLRTVTSYSSICGSWWSSSVFSDLGNSNLHAMAHAKMACVPVNPTKLHGSVGEVTVSRG